MFLFGRLLLLLVLLEQRLGRLRWVKVVGSRNLVQVKVSLMYLLRKSYPYLDLYFEFLALVRVDGLKHWEAKERLDGI